MLVLLESHYISNKNALAFPFMSVCDVLHVHVCAHMCTF